MAILITGANRGIGAGLAAAYRNRGDEVIAAARQGTEVPLDVSDPASVRALADRLSGQPIDLLVCNAGVFLDRGQPLDTGFAPDLWARTFAANVTGVFLTIQTLLPIQGPLLVIAMLVADTALWFTAIRAVFGSRFLDSLIMLICFTLLGLVGLVVLSTFGLVLQTTAGV
jgi:NAD(P)-dependent dehydrogenase (short-subunit alcohol dehydrogenase family)